MTGYDVHYTTMAKAALADDAAAGSNRFPYLGWVDIGHSHKEPKAGIGGLNPGQEYRVRVRAVNDNGAWAVGSGAPLQAARTVSLSASLERVREGDPVTITATVKYEGRATPIQEGLDVLLSTHLGTAEAGDVGTAERISIGKYTDRASVTIQTHRDGDNDDEAFAVLIRWIPKSDFARVGHPAIVWVTITEDDPPPEVLVPELRASGRDGGLHLTWSETTGDAPDGYDVQYKRSSAPDAPATTAGDPETGWVNAGHTGMERSLTITGLTNWVGYDARVRTAFPDSAGPWSDVVTAFPREAIRLGNPRHVTVTVSDATPEEGDTVTLTATLDEPAPREGATIQLWAYGNTTGGTVNRVAKVWSDYRFVQSDGRPPAHQQNVQRDGVVARNRFTTAPLTIRPGLTTATATLLAVRGDDNEGREGIGVYATANVPDADHKHGRWRLKSPKVTMTIYDQGQSPNNAPPEQETGALPSSVTLELGQTSVSESGGTVIVTATLDTPAPADGNGVSLGLYPGNDSTATRNADYAMPDTIAIAAGQRSGTASIVITGDAVDESDETVHVGVFADTGYATLTITDDDTAGVTITAASPLAVDEGSTATYTVVLDSQPVADVTITASSGDVDAASVSPASHTFTSSTWNTAQTFTVSGVADIDTNDESAGISHSVTSTDAKYANGLASTVSVSVSDTTTPPPQQQNRAPTVANAIADATIVNENGTYQVSLSGVFADADSDSLDITAASSNTTKATVSVAADYSSLTGTGKARGTATITATADDGNGGTVQDAFTITVKAALTVASAISDVSRLEAEATQDVSLSGVTSTQPLRRK